MPTCLIMEAANAKNHQRAELPLRNDLAQELAEWIAERRSAA